MDRSPHSLLVGEGAEAFAREEGFTIEPNDSMLSSHTVTAYQKFLENRQSASGHDTIGLIALDLSGNITVGVSTSGAPFKAPGRVGDSPLPGCGLYADQTVGAAAGWCFLILHLMHFCITDNQVCGQAGNRHLCYNVLCMWYIVCMMFLLATGDGDKIMCYCPSFHIVQLMRQGSSPKEACYSVLTDIRKRRGERECFEVGLIALNMKGEVGAASSVEFPYTFWNQGMDSVEKCVISY
ncbi:N(4)-(Beta-N-acetylglucosaminyl)-L-asparaginase isoform X4 [Salminus brasiliensis]